MEVVLFVPEMAPLNRRTGNFSVEYRVSGSLSRTSTVEVVSVSAQRTKLVANVNTTLRTESQKLSHLNKKLNKASNGRNSLQLFVVESCLGVAVAVI